MNYVLFFWIWMIKVASSAVVAFHKEEKPGHNLRKDDEHENNGKPQFDSGSSITISIATFRKSKCLHCKFPMELYIKALGRKPNNKSKPF